MYDNSTKQQSTWYTPFTQSSVIVNGVEHRATTDQDGTLRFTLLPQQEPNVVESFIVSSVIIGEAIPEVKP